MYIYIPRTQMTLVLIEKGLVLGGLTLKIEVTGARGTHDFLVCSAFLVETQMTGRFHLAAEHQLKVAM